MHKIYRKSNKTKSGVHFLHMNNFVPREKQHSFYVSSARNSTASSKSERGEKSVRTVEVCSHLPLLTEQTTNSNRYKCVIHMCMHLFTTSSTISYREKHVPPWKPHSSYTSTGGGGQQESRHLYIWDLYVAVGDYHIVLLLSGLNTNHTQLSHIVCIYAFQALIN